jgi:hypothetical protein
MFFTIASPQLGVSSKHQEQKVGCFRRDYKQVLQRALAEQVSELNHLSRQYSTIPAGQSLSSRFLYSNYTMD